MKRGTLIVITIALIVAAVTLVPTLGVDPEGARRVLAANGYTQIEITGYRWFAGGENDFYHTGFRAKSVTGQVVTGTVTQGLLFKNATIRYD